MPLKKIKPILILIIIGFFVYAFNLNNQLFWDDDEWIKGNVFVHNFSHLKELFTQNVEAGFGLLSNYFRPLLLFSFAFNYVIHGVASFGYHLLSNGFHIANGVLVFLLLSKFLSSRASFLAAVLFLIHPAQTEAVTYISGRGDPMSVFFMLLALLFFIKSTHNQLTFYAIAQKVSSVFFFILAILSRETAILFPLFLMIFYISFLPPLHKAAGQAKEKFIPALKKSLIVSLPFWFISAVYFVLRLTVFNFQNTLNFYAQSNIYTENLSYRLFTFGHALVEYFKIIFWPVRLHMERNLPIHTSIFQWPVWLAVIIVFIILYLVFRFYRLEIRNWKLEIEEQNFRILFFGWSWFFVALAPVSGIIPINALIYEHWLYMPLIGLAALAGFYLDRFFIFLKSKKYSKFYILSSIFLIAYFSFFGVQSIRRNILWGKPIEFYEDILKYSPQSVRIMTNLGNLYSEKGDFAKAEEFFKKAIKSSDSVFFAQPHYNLANLYRDTGRIDQAIGEYKKAIEVDPSFPFAYQNLAVVYINQKQDLAEGAKVLEQLKKIQSGNPKVYYNLGLVYIALGDRDLAIKNLEIGLDLARGRDQETERLITELLNQIER